jgi:hypothetical protein
VYASALDFQGLYTFPNPLSKVPVGACLIADNLTANKDGVAETRRGLAAQGTSLGIVDGWIQGIFSYQNRLICLSIGSATSLVYDSNGSLYFSAFTYNYVLSGSYYFAAVEANKNMYITGIWPWNGPAMYTSPLKMTAYNTEPVSAGVPPGLDGTGVLGVSGSGFLGANEQCAYQIVFGYVDANGNLNLGAPSERILVVNSTGTAQNVVLTFTVPQGLSTSYFYQIYRTPQTTYSATPSLNVPPGAEPQLSAQFNLTSGQISALSVTVTDVTTDALLGAALYTNPSQQGALQPNTPPPSSSDLCFYSQMMFYANCSTLQTLTFSVISVGSPNGIQVNDTIIINGITFTAKASQANASQQFAVYTSGTVSVNIDTTARNLIQCINANAATTNVYAIYLSGYGDLPGLIELQAVNLSISTFYVTASRGGSFYPTLPASGTTFGSSNDVTPNGIYVSKLGQPEAVPAVNLVFVGGGDQPIYRILPLRDRVIVLKSDGVWVITGSTPQTLSVTLLDSTIICIAPATARLLNNSVYCLTQQGVVSITESGVTIQSRAIESQLLSLTAQVYSYSGGFVNISNAVAYESERLYILQMPTVSTDRFPTQCFCYNWITNAWTRWPIDMSAGLVNPYDNVLYCGRPSFNALNIYQERKKYSYSDYMDDQYAVTITGVDATGLVVSLSGTPSASWVGYGLDQTIASVPYVAIIDSVDTVHNTVTVDLVNSSTPNTLIPWANAAATVDVPIPINYQQAPLTGGFPHYLKSWSRVNFWFNGGNFTQITAGFTSDVSGVLQNLSAIMTGGYGFTPFGPGPYGGSFNFPQRIQTLVPTQNAEAMWIMPSLSLSFPRARFSCLGVTATYDIVSDVSG